MKYFNLRKIFQILILIIIIDFSYSYLSFNFPYSLTLANGNIFVIHQKGISICNYRLDTIIENITIFSEDEEIKTEESLSKITTAFDNGYIISIINDKIYIFDENGAFIYSDTKSILETGETAEYYTLVPIKKQIDYYHYIIGYVNDNLLFFFEL